MLRASLIYVAAVVWQPILAFALLRRRDADDGPYDEGIRPAAVRHSLLSIVAAMLVLGIAAGVESLVSGPHAWNDGDDDIGHMVAVFAVIIALLWIQAILEELTWRGLVLPRLMRKVGEWPGLILHGLGWGLCYVPLLVLTGAGVDRSIELVVTMGLLGVVLGWIRLITRSIYASAAANATLTICAGLPLYVLGESSRFAAALQPPGWIPLVVLVVGIAVHRPWRAAISIPWVPLPEHVN
jgi:hypothetical protein